MRNGKHIYKLTDLLVENLEGSYYSTVLKSMQTIIDIVYKV